MHWNPFTNSSFSQQNNCTLGALWQTLNLASSLTKASSWKSLHMTWLFREEVRKQKSSLLPGWLWLYSPGSSARNFRDPRILHYEGSSSFDLAPENDHLRPECFSSGCYWWASLTATPFIQISSFGIVHEGTEQYIVYCRFFHPGISRIPGGMHSSNKGLRAIFVVFKVILTIVFSWVCSISEPLNVSTISLTIFNQTQ